MTKEWQVIRKRRIIKLLVQPLCFSYDLLKNVSVFHLSLALVLSPKCQQLLIKTALHFRFYNLVQYLRD